MKVDSMKWLDYELLLCQDELMYLSWAIDSISDRLMIYCGVIIAKLPRNIRIEIREQTGKNDSNTILAVRVIFSSSSSDSSIIKTIISLQLIH